MHVLEGRQLGADHALGDEVEMGPARAHQPGSVARRGSIPSRITFDSATLRDEEPWKARPPIPPGS